MIADMPPASLVDGLVISPFAEPAGRHPDQTLNDPSDLLYATFLGGNISELSSSIAINAGGAVYVTGWTSSSDFPTTPGAFDMSIGGYTDAFAVKLNGAGSALDYATFLGGE